MMLIGNKRGRRTDHCAKPLLLISAAFATIAFVPASSHAFGIDCVDSRPVAVCRDSETNALQVVALSSYGSATLSNDLPIAAFFEPPIVISLSRFDEFGTPLGSPDIDFTNTGDLSVSEPNTPAFDVSTLGNVRIVNSGQINAASGIVVRSGGGYWVGEPPTDHFVLAGGGDVTIENSGNIQTLGPNSEGAISASASTGSVNVSNTGGLTVADSYAGAIAAQTGGRQDDNAGGVTIVPGGDITISNAGIISALHAHGIQASSEGGNIGVSLTATSTISLLGDLVDGVIVDTKDGNAAVNNAGAVTVEGFKVNAIQATTGADWGGEIHGGGNVSVVNSGTLAIDGAGSFGSTGIYASSLAGDISVVNTGHISAGGDTPAGEPISDAIVARSGRFWNDPTYGGGDISVVNSGTLISNGNSIVAESWGGDVAIGNSGSVTSISNEGMVIAANSQGGDVSVINTGTLTAKALDTDLISAWSQGDAEVRVENNGTLVAEQDGSQGISIEVDGPQDSDVPQTAAALSEVTGSGGITMRGDYSAGMAVHNERGRVSVDYTGNVTTAGDFSQAVSASTNAGTISVKTSGAVTAAGSDSTAIWAASGNPNDSGVWQGGGKISVEVAGGSVQGGSGSRTFGIAQPEGDGDKHFIGSSGVLFIGGAENTLVNNGRISALNGLAVAVFEGDLSFTNYDYNPDTGEETESTVTVSFPAADLSITNKAAGVIAGDVVTGSGADAIANAGTINGNINLGAGNNSITNAGSGLIAGNIVTGNGRDAITNEGTINGNIDLGAGANSITNADSGLIAGNILTGNGIDTVTNEGTFNGNIDLGAGANELTNAGSGLINSGSAISVGAGNTFTNAGILSPGGANATQVTTITGNFTQTSAGRLLIDINDGATPMSDRLNVSGAASLAGAVVPNVVNITQEINKEYLIVSAAGGSTDNGIAPNPTNVKVADTVGYDFGVRFDGNGKDVYLTADKNSTLDDLAGDAAVASGGNTQVLGVVGDTLSSAEEHGGSGLVPLLNALRLKTDLASLGQTLSRLVTQGQGSQVSNTVKSGNAFANTMLSCAERNGEYAYTREGQCYYAKVGARELERDVTSQGAGSDETAYEVMGGAQVALEDQLRFGFALGYEDISSKVFDDVQTLSHSDGDRVSLGLVLKNQWGPVNGYINLTGSYADYEHRRVVGLGAGMDTAIGEQEAWSMAMRMRLTRLFDHGSWYWKPLVDIAGTYGSFGGYVEHGAGAANLNVDGSHQWLFSVTPSIEVGAGMTLVGGTVVRPYARAGLIVFSQDDASLTANFANAPAGVTPFLITSGFDQVAADVEAGVTVLTPSGVNVKLNYDGRYGESSRQHGANVKVTAPF